MSPSADRLRFRRATLADAQALVADMRPADRDEITASSGPNLLATVQRAIGETPDCVACEFGGRLVSIGGAVPLSLLSGEASPWMLGTSLFQRFPGRLTRAARTYLARMQQTYPHLVNYVDARNVQSVRWLRRLGFEIHPAAPHGVAGLPFHRFERHV